MVAKAEIGSYWKDYITGKTGSFGKPVITNDVISLVPTDNDSVVDISIVPGPEETGVFIRGANPAGIVKKAIGVEYHNFPTGPEEPESVLFVLTKPSSVVEINSTGTEKFVKVEHQGK